MTLPDLFNETATDSEKAWLTSKQQAPIPARLAAFVAVPRFVSRRPVPHNPDWTMDRLARVLLLTSLPADDETAYTKAIETLFDTAEMQELAALYSALPHLAFPQKWLFRATEAVRSNMGPVFDAIAFGNTYPAQYFTEAAWNQLVLKCIFNDKPITRIHGLMDRANATLAHDISEFAHERWAAGRTVPAEVWQLVPRFMNESLLADVKRLAASPDERDREAARRVIEQMSSRFNVAPSDTGEATLNIRR
ncbi:EboA domain-containing protein [Fibrella sp. HMF5335]|uniref:EboA domain-containing protein n=1 Tax=Fibrella rubiginis TaxID=2817060 RepID=A0A939K0J3_9BACT|nr:EboA domain-containing protein [Fibrella rubiginis]MBO0936157.1 EboA domain-containing protein [Fibrella rubiginis]